MTAVAARSPSSQTLLVVTFGERADRPERPTPREVRGTVALTVVDVTPTVEPHVPRLPVGPHVHSAHGLAPTGITNPVRVPPHGTPRVRNASALLSGIVASFHRDCHRIQTNHNAITRS